MIKKIVINGRIFEFPITGVGRFCYETIRELDKIIENDNNKWELALPIDATNIPELKNIRVRVIGKATGIIWEQITFPSYLRKTKSLALNMSNSIPLLHPDFAIIHDLNLKVNKNNLSSIFEKIKVQWPLLHYKIIAKKAKVIFTDSNYQKKEIIQAYGVNESRICVTYPGWEHMNSIIEDDNILERYSLKRGEYYFAVSTRAKNKNFKWIVDVSKNNKQSLFVIAGKLETKYFSDKVSMLERNIITTGYISDGEMKALMRNCKAFIYPSTYEGFGIPPLEALSVGAKVIVSDSSCLPEVYNDCAYYISPYDSHVDLDMLISRPIEKPRKLLDKYSWEITAKNIYRSINQFE